MTRRTSNQRFVSVDIAAERREYLGQRLLESEAPAEPLELFSTWLDQALAAGLLDATAMVLSTASKEGRPSARVVSWARRARSRRRRAASSATSPSAKSPTTSIPMIARGRFVKEPSEAEEDLREEGVRDEHRALHRAFSRWTRERLPDDVTLARLHATLDQLVDEGRS